jgi:excisionase family DNA binding protein
MVFPPAGFFFGEVTVYIKERSMAIMRSRKVRHMAELSLDDEILLYTRAEVARKLRCSQTTVDTLMRDGIIPVVQIGRRRFVQPAALMKFLEASKV